MSELWDIAQQSGRKDATWQEFPYGMHSMYLLRRLAIVLADVCATDNTCMQRDYWRIVSEFVERVGGPLNK